MKKLIYITSFMAVMLTTSGCKKWLDVNKNPNAPDKVTPNLYLSPIQNNLTLSQQFDGRYIGKYIQNWAEITTLDTWDRQGYLFSASDPASEQWRTVYFLMGYNLVDMMNLSEEQQRWDLLGIGYLLKAWGWMQLTTTHGEIIVSQAFQLERTKFDYDNQDYIYGEIIRLLNLSIANLNRTDGAVSQTFLSGTDLFFAGDRLKWLKFAHGVKAMAMNHLSLKGSAYYKPDEILTEIDLALASNADNVKLKFAGTASALSNFYGPWRNNLTTFRQTNFIVNLLNGTQFGGVVDPRLKRLLMPSSDGNVYGLDPTFGYGALTTAQRPPNVWNSTTFGETLPGNYVFSNKSSYPLMTYSQLQFIKAEAAFKKGDKITALDAYKKGIDAHIDYVNTMNAEAGNPAVTQISAAEKTAFMTSAVVPTVAANLRLSDIMCQKYIAQWGWAINETWTDLRRYHYTDPDPEVPTVQVFKGFTIPAADRIAVENQNKPVYRLRPRYNSEWVWNIESLEKIGGRRLDYHTIPAWIFTNP